VADVRADCRSKQLGSRRDRVDVVGLPEKQVDGLEGYVVAEAWGRVDRHESALDSAVEDVARRQVAVQEGCWWDVLGEPGRELAPAFVQLNGDQLEEFRVALVRVCPGVEEVRDVVREWRIGRVGNAVRVQRRQKVGRGLRVGVEEGLDERGSRFDRFDEQRSHALVDRQDRRSVYRRPPVECCCLVRQHANGTRSGLNLLVQSGAHHHDEIGVAARERANAGLPVTAGPTGKKKGDGHAALRSGVDERCRRRAAAKRAVSSSTACAC
jgi:hypothetical protein